MKKLYALLVGMMMAVMTASALSYDDAARQAYYLTDKMAYELDLTDYQYDRVYQINYDYLLRCNYERDINGYLWEYRNAALARVLTTRQWRKFNRRDWFFRPLRWLSGSWYFPVYERYHSHKYYRPAPPPSYHGPAHHHGGATPPPPPGGHGHNNGYKPSPGQPAPNGGGYKPQPNNPPRNNGGYRGGNRNTGSNNKPAPAPNGGGNKPTPAPNGGGRPQQHNSAPTTQPSAPASRPVVNSSSTNRGGSQSSTPSRSSGSSRSSRR